MGLKTDILEGLRKNLRHFDEVVERDPITNEKKTKLKMVDPPIGKDSKLEILATDLSLAIRDFITAQTFRVDKLSTNYTSGTTPVTVGPPAPHTIPLLDIGVDKNGQARSNPVLGGKTDSDTSEVRLRKNEVDKKSME